MAEQDHMDLESFFIQYKEYMKNQDTLDPSYFKELLHLRHLLDAEIAQLQSESATLPESCSLSRGSLETTSTSVISTSDIFTQNTLDIILGQIDAIYLEGDTKGVHKVLGKSEQILGYTIDEWMEYPGGPMQFWADNIHPDHKSVVDQCLELTIKGVDHEFVYRMIAKNGSIVWIHDKISVTPQGDDYLIQAFMIDITEKKAVEMQMVEQNKFNEIGRIAMGIAHDFNNILAGIVGYSSILEELVKNPEYLELIEGITKATEQGTQLSRNLLTYGKSHEKLVEVINVNDILKNIKSLIRYKVANHIQIDLDLDPELKAIQADFSQITQVLLNLVVNAIEAVDEEGKVIISTKNVKLDQVFVDQFVHRFPGHYIKIDVMDTGNGIEHKMAEKIFQPFFTTKRSGSGLGLSVVKNIVDGHEGIITFSTQETKGTTFTVYFPSVDQQVDDNMFAEMELQYGTGRLLCVDDNEMVRDILDKVLTHLGYEVEIFCNPKSAISYYEQHYESIDGVILDYIMPDLTGDLLFESLKEINPDINAIMVTGYGQEFDFKRVHELGIETILVKPFKIEHLSQRIHDMINKE